MVGEDPPQGALRVGARKPKAFVVIRRGSADGTGTRHDKRQVGSRGLDSQPGAGIVGKRPQDVAAATAFTLPTPRRGTEAQPPGAPGGPPGRVLPEDPGTQQADTPGQPAPDGCGSHRRARERHLLEPLATGAQLAPIAPPRLLAALAAADAHDLERTDGEKRDVVGLRQQTPPVDGDLLKLLERLPAVDQRHQRPSPAAAADHPEPAAGRIEGDPPPARQMLQRVVLGEGGLADQAARVHRRETPAEVDMIQEGGTAVARSCRQTGSTPILG